jgi:hypothetical protein
MMWEAVVGEEGLLDILHNGPLQNGDDRKEASVVCLLLPPSRG